MHLLLFLACQHSDSETPKTLDSSVTDSSTTDSSTTDSQGTTDTAPPAGLHGEIPENPLPLPDFTATAMNGETRTKADLLGHPTVIWFYPAATTAG